MADPATAGTSPYAPQTYDAVWSMALALREAEAKWRTTATAVAAITLADFDYQRVDMSTEFQRRLEHLSFMGVSVGTTRFAVQPAQHAI